MDWDKGLSASRITPGFSERVDLLGLSILYFLIALAKVIPPEISYKVYG
jgi:hypothetical protein